MAMLIRDQYRLMTLRCWIGFREDKRAASGQRASFAAERVLRTQLFDGSLSLDGPRDTPLEQLGLDPHGFPPARDSMPPLEGTAIADQLRLAANANPAAIWFHISQDSSPLALLPWEEMVKQVVPLPVLRIGNFLNDPYQPSPAPNIAICASQPIGDGPYALAEFVAALLSSIDEAAGSADVWPTVHLFAEAQWLPPIAQAVGARLLNRIVVETVPPPLAAADPSGEPASPVGPWLGWMIDHFEGEVVDIVHFITPGWYSENHGAIALSEAPGRNTGHGHFLGAAELAGFYDRLGCSAMAFSSPDMPEWEWGQRMLAFELSWIRPGPVLVFEHDYAKYATLGPLYALLFGQGPDAVEALASQNAPSQLTCHPQLLTARAPESPPMVDVLSSAEKPARPADLLSKRVNQAMAQLHRKRDLSMAEQWEAAGVAKALDFLKTLV
jgi:hypothetical protein